MRIKVDPGLLERVCCPACKSKMEQSDTVFTCQNQACNREFPVVDGVPILIDDDNSLFAIEAYLKRSAVFFKQHGRAYTWLATHLPHISLNLKAAQNYRIFAELLCKEAKGKPKVLVIGGGVLGKGMGSLREANVQLINSDVAMTDLTEIVLDSHSIPFEDETFDGVIAQAVLEHVLEPHVCVAEIHRVLKSGGLVYAEVPFMQQVHGGGYDFTRFTHLGIMNLFKKFEEANSGPCCGPGMALAWAIQNFLLAFTKVPTVRRIIKGLASITLFPLKYFDYVLIDRPGAFDAASAYFYMGRKNGDKGNIHKRILSQYRGAV